MLVLAPVGAPAQVSFGVGADDTSGKYGEASATHSLSVPLIAQLTVDDWTLNATVPYLRVAGPADVIFGVGRTGPQAPPAVAPLRTAEGLGDILAGVTYAAYQHRGLDVEVVADVKLGTASRAHGLGTGREDYDAHVDLYQTVGAYLPYVSVGYRVYGRLPGADLRNGCFGTVGVNDKVNRADTVGLAVDLAEKSSRAGRAEATSTLSLTHAWTEKWSTRIYLLKGYSSYSPDTGFGGQLGWNF